jgi:hypothetical protein
MRASVICRQLKKGRDGAFGICPVSPLFVQVARSANHESLPFRELPIVGHIRESRTKSEVGFQIAHRSSKDCRESWVYSFKFACGDRFVGANPGVYFSCRNAEFAAPFFRGVHRLIFVSEVPLLQRSDQGRCLAEAESRWASHWKCTEKRFVAG